MNLQVTKVQQHTRTEPSAEHCHACSASH